MLSILQASQLPVGSCLRVCTFAQLLAKVFIVALSLKARSRMQSSELRWMHGCRKIFKLYCQVEKANEGVSLHMETVPGVFIPRRLLWSPQGGDGMESKRPGSCLPRWFFGVFFYWENVFVFCLYNLKIHQGKKKRQAKCTSSEWCARFRESKSESWQNRSPTRQ